MSENKQEKKPGIEPGKGVNRGCGRWIASCGHQGTEGQSAVWLSGTCACGLDFRVGCSGILCAGQDFYC